MKRFLILLFFSTSVLAEPLAPPFIKSITPTSGPSSGGTTVVITGDNFGAPNLACILPCPTRVRFDGTDAQLLDSSNTSLVVKTPAHEKGPVDVTVISPDGRTGTATAAFVYTDADESAYQKILLPIYLESTANGSNGSSWQTQLWMQNNNAFPVSFVVQCPIGALCVPTFPLTQSLQPGDTIVNLTPTLQVNPGRLLFVDRAGADNVSFGLRLYESSRNASDAGVEIPVVRESAFRSSTVHLHNVPFDDRYRIMLRIYELAVDNATFNVTVSSESAGRGPGQVFNAYTLTATSPESGLFRAHPGYVEHAGFSAPIPALPIGTTALRFDIQPATPGSRFWAFVSITNNDTQHVTLVTPQ